MTKFVIMKFSSSEIRLFSIGPLRKGENNYMFVERNPHTGEAMYDYSAKYVVYQHNEHGDEITIFFTLGFDLHKTKSNRNKSKNKRSKR